jgi:hypothetical protein
MAKGERMDADIRRYGGEGEDVTKHGREKRVDGRKEGGGRKEK